MRRVLYGLLFLLAAAGGFLAYIGYFGGPVFIAMRPAQARGAVPFAAVMLSGDMGFRVGMGPKLAERLTATGVPLVGVNSLTYFRVRRQPEEIAQLIVEGMRRAEVLAPGRKLILMGQSFGADMLVAGLSRMPAAMRQRVRAVILIVPGDTIDYRASPAELFGWEKPDAQALPLASQLTWAPIVCIHGAEEGNSLCPQWTGPNVRQVTLPGGHHLNNDVDALAHAVNVSIRDLKRGRADG